MGLNLSLQLSLWQDTTQPPIEDSPVSVADPTPVVSVQPVVLEQRDRDGRIFVRVSEPFRNSDEEPHVHHGPPRHSAPSSPNLSPHICPDCRASESKKAENRPRPKKVFLQRRNV